MVDGEAEAAVRFSTPASDGRIVSLSRYGEGGTGAPGAVERAVCSLPGREPVAIDSPARHEFTSTPATSHFVGCDTGAGVDALSERPGEASRL
jgi:predicted 3-demethylubiquinone-9 3-methyltransferase (glyoxalase superfamily)